MIDRGMSRRISWWELPGHVRIAAEASIGSAVVEAVSQPGGYSAGAAARVQLANGRRAFVKALSVDIHAASVNLYRNEAAVMPYLSAGLPVPRLLDAHD